MQLARSEGGMGWGGSASGSGSSPSKNMPPMQCQLAEVRGGEGGARFTWSAQNRRQVNQVSRQGF